ncbi:MAG: lysylphosphatidylglycerol synthase transmembrane domain-containing protein [Thermoanaerobaculia bacterium]
MTEAPEQQHFAVPHVVEPRPLRLAVLRLLPIVVILGLLVHFVLPRLGEIDETFETLDTLAPWAIGLAIAAEVMSYVSNGALLKTVIGLADERLSLRRAIAIETGAATVALVAAGALGFGAAIYKWTLKRGISRETAVLASWLPSVFDSATLVLFALVGAVELLVVHKLSRASSIALVIVVSVLTILITGLVILMARNDWMIAIAHRVASLIKRIRPKWDPSVLIDSAERAGSAWETLRGTGWLRPAFCSFMVLTFDVACLYFVFRAAGQHISLSLLLAGYGVPILLGRSSFLPGGIAVIEVAMAALYGGLGVPANVAVVVVLTYRLISFWMPSLIGIPLAIGLQSRKPHAERV